MDSEDYQSASKDLPAPEEVVTNGGAIHVRATAA